MVPPAGVEPATYRLGGESSKASKVFDFEAILNDARPITCASQHAHKLLIQQETDFHFGRDSGANKRASTPGIAQNLTGDVKSSVELLQSVDLYCPQNN